MGAVQLDELSVCEMRDAIRGVVRDNLEGPRTLALAYDEYNSLLSMDMEAYVEGP